MNDRQKTDFVNKLKRKYPSIYKNMNITDAIMVHKLRKNRGKE